MSGLKTYPVGSKVKIVHRRTKPSNWNSDMMALGGKTAYITIAGIKYASTDNTYRYKIDISPYTWRHIDFVLLKLPKIEPNLAFRYKKHGH